MEGRGDETEEEGEWRRMSGMSAVIGESWRREGMGIYYMNKNAKKERFVYLSIIPLCSLSESSCCDSCSSLCFLFSLETTSS